MAVYKAKRGRKPSIAVASTQVVEMSRALRGLMTEMRRLRKRLALLDAFYSNQGRTRTALSKRTPQSRRGPNVRDLAHDVLKKTRKALPIRELARRVTRARGGRAGQQFAQNLSVALGRDRRFKRVERGVYGLR